MNRYLDTLECISANKGFEGFEMYKCYFLTNSYYDNGNSIARGISSILNNSYNTLSTKYFKVNKDNAHLFKETHKIYYIFEPFSYIMNRLREPIPGEKLFVAKSSNLPRNRMSGFFERAKAPSNTISTVVTEDVNYYGPVYAEKYHIMVNDELGAAIIIKADKCSDPERLLRKLEFTNEPRFYERRHESVEDYKMAKELFYHNIQGFKKAKTAWYYGLKSKQIHLQDILSCKGIHDFVSDKQVFKICNNDMHDFDCDFMTTCIEYLLGREEDYDTLLLHTLASMNYDKYRLTVSTFINLMTNSQRHCAGSSRTDVKFMAYYLNLDIKAWKVRIKKSFNHVYQSDWNLLCKMYNELISRNDSFELSVKSSICKFMGLTKCNCSLPLDSIKQEINII